LLEKVRPQILSRRDTEIVETDKNVRALQETPIPYGQKVGLKNGAKALYGEDLFPIGMQRKHMLWRHQFEAIRKPATWMAR